MKLKINQNFIKKQEQNLEIKKNKDLSAILLNHKITLKFYIDSMNFE